MSNSDTSSSNNITPSSPSSNSTQHYSSSSIQNFLKQKDNLKQFMIVKNDQKCISSTAWSIFGFPARRVEDGSYRRIDGFTSCFECKDTYSFPSSGGGSTKHLLKHVCSKR
jgi:hypothetical protein